MLTIFFLVDGLEEFGGVEERLSALAIELQKQGHRALVVSRLAVLPDNQYRQRLAAHGIRLIAPSQELIDMLGDWNTKAQLIEKCTKMCTPLFAALVVPYAVVRRWPLRTAWLSMANVARTSLGRILLPDRVDSLFYRTLDWYAWRLSPDVIHVHGYRLACWQGVEWAQCHKLPTLFEEHSSPSNGFAYHSLALDSPSRATMMITVSQAAARELSKQFGADTCVKIVPPIVSIPAGGKQRDEAVGDADGALTITCIARLAPEKGLEYLLMASQNLAAKYRGLRLLIYGDGELKGDLLRLAERLGVLGFVKFCGMYRRAELPVIMSGTDIFVLPSLSEAFPLAIIEAMAFCKPVVASDVGGIPDLITNGVTGLLVPAADVESLTEALASLIDNPSRRQQMGTAAHDAFLAGRFTPDAVVEQMLPAYRWAIAQNARG